MTARKDSVLRVAGRRKHFGTNQAVKGKDFHACPSQIVGLRGWNLAAQTIAAH